MPILPDPRHERFAQNLADGKGNGEAYKLAWESDTTPAAASVSANRVLKNHSVAIRERVAEILAEREAIRSKGLALAVERTGITTQRVLEELAKIGFANMADYMRVGADGDPALDFSALTRDQAAALAEVTVEDFKDGRGEEARDVRRVKFKLADKRAALVDIGRHLGMFIERREVGAPGDFKSMEIDELEVLFRSELAKRGVVGPAADAVVSALKSSGSGQASTTAH